MLIRVVAIPGTPTITTAAATTIPTTASTTIATAATTYQHQCEHDPEWSFETSCQDCNRHYRYVTYHHHRHHDYGYHYGSYDSRHYWRTYFDYYDHHYTYGSGVRFYQF